MKPDTVDATERDYRRLRETAAPVDLMGWTVLRLAGPDTRTFLQGLATQDLEDARPGAAAADHARSTLFLTEKGRPVALAWVALAADGESAVVIADEGARAHLRAHFDRFLVMEEVEIAGPDEMPVLAGFAGPDRAALLASAAGIAGSTPIPSEPLSFLLLPQGAAAPAIGEPAGATAFEAWRLAVGLPRTGVDLELDRIATEVSLAEAISLTKGCYVGQEVVARTSNRGQVRRHRVGFRFDWPGQALPSRSEIWVDDAPAGYVTSTVLEPGTHGGLGMGYITTDLPPDGAHVLLGGRALPLVVAPWPL